LSGDEQTKRKALNLLLRSAEEQRRTLPDEQLREAVSDDLVTAVFELAWKHQWDRSSADFTRETRPIVDQAVDGAVQSVED
jgi:hypothetical protein